MNEPAVLTLHCPQCRELTEVVAEDNSLVCLVCGWRFDDRVAARFLAAAKPDPAAAERLLAEAADPTVAVILLDVVLGWGSHADPAGALAPAIRQARAIASAARSVSATKARRRSASSSTRPM